MCAHTGVQIRSDSDKIRNDVCAHTESVRTVSKPKLSLS